jgi:hypothetical protein
LDLLGWDLSDDSAVFVENQFGQSDDGHLGQILTYAAGTNPRAIVWITTGFRPEHRAAMDWLNERTDPDTRFFGVEIKVVRIGDSRPAPNFRLVAEPSDWEKHVKAAVTGRENLYWYFWEEFRTRVVAEHPGWTNRKTSRRQAWYTLAPYTMWAPLGASFTREGLIVLVYLDIADPAVNLARFEALRAKKVEFEEALGEEATWDPMIGRRAARIYVTAPFEDVEDVSQWPEMIDWLMDQHARFRRAIPAVAGRDLLREWTRPY